ncbi:hypothetical protein [Curtobacterium sp. ISL-83]|uniref:hypothetical protein n=1 Tax=Curtobacterium sp. ISL-83 TaxID=2819145 RepID=UPI001BE9C7CF|nr:hypothetical protein [Curtobacterium sp. ISL-83]MBT2501318.1 hypothetical protein [Curtobacterium sp. ISL-83]
MRPRSSTSLTSTILLACGFVLTALGGSSNANTAAGDPNIGAGVVFLSGVLLGFAGLLTWAVQAAIVLTHGRR